MDYISNINILLLLIIDICKAWFILSFKNRQEKFENEIIWNNLNIKVNNKTVFNQFLHLKGIDDFIHIFFFVSSIMIEEYCSIMYLWKSILDNFPCIMCNRLISAVPTLWTENLLNTDYSDNNNETAKQYTFKHTPKKYTIQWQ